MKHTILLLLTAFLFLMSCKSKHALKTIINIDTSFGVTENIHPDNFGDSLMLLSNEGLMNNRPDGNPDTFHYSISINKSGPRFFTSKVVGKNICRFVRMGSRNHYWDNDSILIKLAEELNSETTRTAMEWARKHPYHSTDYGDSILRCAYEEMDSSKLHNIERVYLDDSIVWSISDTVLRHPREGKVKCNCPCHKPPYGLHFMPCCEDGYKFEYPGSNGHHWHLATDTLSEPKNTTGYYVTVIYLNRYDTVPCHYYANGTLRKGFKRFYVSNGYYTDDASTIGVFYDRHMNRIYNVDRYYFR